MDFSERPWHPARLWRRLRRPKNAGQKRYFLVARRGGKAKSDPGYLLALLRIVRDSMHSELIIIEQIAVPLPSGGLAWVGGGNSAHSGYSFHGPRHLRIARKLVRQLNRQPLGSSIRQEVSPDGKLEIYRLMRIINSPYYLTKIEESSSSQGRFDVSDKAGAAAAMEHYQKLQQEIDQTVAIEIDKAISWARTAADDKLRSQFTDPQLNQKIKETKQFAEALSRGQFDHIKAQINDREQLNQVESAKARQAKNQLMSARAQRTIQALTASEQESDK